MINLVYIKKPVKDAKTLTLFSGKLTHLPRVGEQLGIATQIYSVTDVLHRPEQRDVVIWVEDHAT